jgi:predicted transcriptional regulator
MPDDARSPKTKTAKEVAKHFGVSERTVRANHMAEERDTYEAREQTTGAIWPGPCERKGNHGLKSPRRLGAANGLPVGW